MQNKILWITGASSGIGRACAVEAVNRGYKIAITARRLEKLESLKQELVDKGTSQSSVFVSTADVTSSEQVNKSYIEIAQHFGQIDILLANAGSHTPSSARKFDVEAYKKLFNINFFGALSCIEVVLDEMLKRKSGHIVAVSSVAGYSALPTAACYGASKSALTYFLDSLRFDLKPKGIDVTVVSPGFVKTELTDLNEFDMPFIIESDLAAKYILDGIERRDFEVHFPYRFTLSLKFLRLLPQRLYHFIISKTIK